jgi:hypothetical protein
MNIDSTNYSTYHQEKSYKKYRRGMNLPPNPIVDVNSKSPFDSSYFTILFSLEYVDHSLILMSSTAQTFGAF